ncbi:TetR/AcrR family transcriptional regulator [Paenibacillus sp. FSL H8-0537]|uniref:TetR/AcrR family transcriptional regulator n=1 Tax=Paenibacillus sp. FSL H8-0537 TaxID=2921399 RepID=UPI0031017534
MVKGRSDGEETKRRIARAAKQLFLHKGYGAVSMNEVCDNAKVSKGSLYHHFPSKEQLFLEVVEEDSEQWRLAWDRKRERLATVEEQLYALAEHYAHDFQNPLMKAMEEFSRSQVITQDVLDRLLLIMNNASQACRDLIREGQASGIFVSGDEEELVLIVSSMMEGLGKVYFTIDSEQQPERISKLFRQAASLLLNGIRAK